nr:hypothetical protein [uncultured Draconibacterium sp.]
MKKSVLLLLVLLSICHKLAGRIGLCTYRLCLLLSVPSFGTVSSVVA